MNEDKHESGAAENIFVGIIGIVIFANILWLAWNVCFNFVKEVIYGQTVLSDYLQSLRYYSYQPIVDFYISAWERLKEVGERLTH